MLITLCSLFSFTSYSIFTYNKTLKKEMSPFLFLGTLFSLFFIEFTGLYGLSISYTTFFILDIFFLTITCIFFYIFFLKTIYDNRFNKEFWKKLKVSCLQNLVYLFVMIFFTVFLLFFHINALRINSDNIYYQALSMHYLSNKTNAFSSYIINNNHSALSYSIVGYYSFLASLNLKQILLNYPYFNMFLYFYLILSTIYFINIKFVEKSWINILLYICIFIFIFLIYFYGSKLLGYLLYGNYTSSFFFGLLIIPSLFISKNKQFHYKYIIPLLLLSMLFYNETAILCGLVYLVAYFIFLIFMKRKIRGIFITLPTILCLAINGYLWICYYFANKENLDTSELFVFKLLPLVVFAIMILLICVIFLDAIKNLNLKIFKNISSIYIKLNNIFTLPKIKKINTDWFFLSKKRNINKFYEIAIGLIITGFFVFLMWIENWKSIYDMNTDLLTKNWIIIGSIIFFILFYTSFIFLNKNFFFNFYILLVFISCVIFTILVFLDHSAFESGILNRLLFASITMITFLNPATVYLYVATILYVFVIIIINKQIKKYNFNTINKNSTLYVKYKFFRIISMSSITSCAVLSSILTPCIMNNKNSFLTISNIETNFYGKMSIETLYQLSKFNFDNKLTFSIIPLPIINQTSFFNIQYRYYMYYWNINTFLNNIQTNHYFEQPAFINPKTMKYFYEISNKNWEEDILPYYKYIVIRSFNKKFLDYIYYINKNKISDFRLVKNINDKLFIFDNENYNQIKDNTFYKYNDNRFL